MSLAKEEKDKKDKPKPRLLLAVDVETRGQDPERHGLVSIGLYGKEIGGSFQISKRINVLPSNWQHMERRCEEEFWNRFPDLLKELSKEAWEASYAITEFECLIETLRDDYEVDLLSDNPSFDFAFLNHYLHKYRGGPSLAYKRDRTSKFQLSYEGVWDIDEWVRAEAIKKFGNKWITIVDKEAEKAIKSTATHYPEEDAKSIHDLALHRLDMCISSEGFELPPSTSQKRKKASDDEKE